MSARLLEAALNGVWQGGLLALGMAAAMRLIGARLPPATRHHLWWLTLSVVVLLPVVGILPEHARGTAAPEAQVVPERAPAPVASPTMESVTSAASEAAAESEAVAQSPSSVLPASGPAAFTVSAGAGAALALAYVACVLVLLVRLLAQGRRARGLVRTLRLPRQELRPALAALRASSAVKRLVRIGVSDGVAVPATIGLVQPVVLIPAELEQTLDSADLEPMVLHELAHVARWDDRTALVARLLEVFFFFQPAVVWITRRIALEREHACDEWVVAHGAGRLEYARCLLRVGEHAVARRSPLPAGALSMASRLAERIDRVLETPVCVRRPRLRSALLCVAPLALGATVAATPGLRIDAPRVLAIDPVRDPVNGPAAASRIDALLRRFETYGLDGAVLVAKDGEVVLRAGYGLSDRARGIAFDPSMPFNGGAFAKLLTATAVLKLEEEGRLRVTDRVTAHLGEFPPPKTDVTIHQLLTHTAGLARPWAPVYRNDRAAFIEAMKTTPAEYAPGTGHRYTDQGHALLAAVIEVVSGETYEAYVRRVVLEPAGMSSTRFEFERVPGGASVVAEYVEPAGAESRVGERAYVWGRRGAMGVITTVDDLWRFHRAFEGGTLVTPATRTKMLTGYTDAGRFTKIGYGWEVGATPLGTRLRHRLSAWNSSSVEIVYDEDEDLFIALVASAPTDWGRPKYLDLLGAALDRSHFQPPPAIALPDADLRVFEGRYELASGAVLDVAVDGTGRLRLDTEDAAVARVLAQNRAARATVTARAIALKHTFAVAQWHRHDVLPLSFDPEAGTLSVPGLGTAVKREAQTAGM